MEKKISTLKRQVDIEQYIYFKAYVLHINYKYRNRLQAILNSFLLINGIESQRE